MSEIVTYTPPEVASSSIIPEEQIDESALYVRGIENDPDDPELFNIYSDAMQKPEDNVHASAEQIEYIPYGLTFSLEDYTFFDDEYKNSKEYQKLEQLCALTDKKLPTCREDLKQFIFDIVTIENKVFHFEIPVLDTIFKAPHNFEPIINTGIPPQNADTCCDITTDDHLLHLHASWHGINKASLVMLALIKSENAERIINILAQETSQQKYPELGNKSLSEIPQDELLFALSDLIIQRKEKEVGREKVTLNWLQRQEQLATRVITLAVQKDSLTQELTLALRAETNADKMGWSRYDRIPNELEQSVNNEQTQDFLTALREKRSQLKTPVDSKILLQELQQLHQDPFSEQEQQQCSEKLLVMTEAQFKQQLSQLNHQEISFILELHAEITTRPLKDDELLSDYDKKLQLFGQLLNQSGYFFVNRLSTTEHTSGYHGEIVMRDGKAVFDSCAHHTPELDNKINEITQQAEQILDSAITNSTEADSSKESLQSTMNELIYPHPLFDRSSVPSSSGIESVSHIPSSPSTNTTIIVVEEPRRDVKKRKRVPPSEQEIGLTYKVSKAHYSTSPRKEFAPVIFPIPKSDVGTAEEVMKLPQSEQKKIAKEHKPQSIKLLGNDMNFFTTETVSSAKQEVVLIPKEQTKVIQKSINYQSKEEQTREHQQVDSAIKQDVPVVQSSEQVQPQPIIKPQTVYVSQAHGSISVQNIPKEAAIIAQSEVHEQNKMMYVRVAREKRDEKEKDFVKNLHKSQITDTNSPVETVSVDRSIVSTVHHTIVFSSVKNLPSETFAIEKTGKREQPSVPVALDMQPKAVQLPFQMHQPQKEVIIGQSLAQAFEQKQEQMEESMLQEKMKEVSQENVVTSEKTLGMKARIKKQDKENAKEVHHVTQEAEKTSNRGGIKQEQHIQKLESKMKKEEFSQEQEEGTHEQEQRQQKVSQSTQQTQKTQREELPPEQTAVKLKSIQGKQTTQLALSIQQGMISNDWDLQSFVKRELEQQGINKKIVKVKVKKNLISSVPCAISEKNITGFITKYSQDISQAGGVTFAYYLLKTEKRDKRRPRLLAVLGIPKYARMQLAEVRKHKGIPNGSSTVFFVN